MKAFLNYFLIFTLLFGCGTAVKKNIILPITTTAPISDFKNLNTENKTNWHFKDIIRDSVPGISLNSEVMNMLKNKVSKEVIVAIIDASTDIDHSGLKNRIWTNKKEIRDNNIDDDKNGYIDDIHGWNFLGHKDKNSTEFTNYAYTRILKKYKEQFQNQTAENVKAVDKEKYDVYSRALKVYNKNLKYAEHKYKNDSTAFAYFNVLKIKYDKVFNNKEYGVSDLDSLQNVIDLDSVIKMNIKDMKTMIKYKISLKNLKEEEYLSFERIHKLLNLNYNDRELIGDDENNIDDRIYGNNIVNHNPIRMKHGTYTFGILSQTFTHMEELGGQSNIKIMPISISGYGDENDKDMALAIRYAVNNGAGIINISSGKQFSLHKDWVQNAIRYAETKNVLIIHSSGNEGEDLENGHITKYPNDNSFDGEEISNNFLNVGASTHFKKEQLISRSSNYGITEVDVFAPGQDIYTMTAGGGYKFVSGTSFATAITSGVCALLRSYYPKLTAKQIKKIIMKSVVKYYDSNYVKIASGKKN